MISASWSKEDTKNIHITITIQINIKMFKLPFSSKRLIITVIGSNSNNKQFLASSSDRKMADVGDCVAAIVKMLVWWTFTGDSKPSWRCRTKPTPSQHQQYAGHWPQNLDKSTPFQNSQMYQKSFQKRSENTFAKSKSKTNDKAVKKLW